MTQTLNVTTANRRKPGVRSLAPILWLFLAPVNFNVHAGAAPAKGAGAPYLVKGTIASNRLGDSQCAFLRSASHVRGAVRAPAVELDPSIAAALAGVLLDDRIWVERPGLYTAQGSFLPLRATVNFSISNETRVGTVPRIDIDIDPVSQQMRTMSWGFPGSQGVERSTNYSLAAPQMTALLKKAFPQNAEIQALSVVQSPAPTVAATIPSAARDRIAALHTGMTRADLLKLFTTEGGLSNQFQRTYIYRGEGVSLPIDTETKADGTVVHKHLRITEFVKINAEFMPRTAHLKWIDGAGVLIDPEELYHFDDLGEQPDDVIVRLSTPYLGMETLD